ncbi:hypothetical protein EA635_26110, partial [Salmonella enterica subsp. enterica serovar Anatum]|nr:hypothetical protein [Salmonella enterica subsp. enterica serovar Anatum]
PPFTIIYSQSVINSGKNLFYGLYNHKNCHLQAIRSGCQKGSFCKPFISNPVKSRTSLDSF